MGKNAGPGKSAEHFLQYIEGGFEMTLRILDTNEVERLRVAINNDPEFKIIGRYMTVNIVMEFGNDKRLFKVREGDLKEIVPALSMIDPIDIYIRGREEFWEKFLLPVPPPRFQSMRAATNAGNCEISGNSELYSAYFPAINRMVNMMRELQNN